jgi:ribonuclease G
MSKEICVSSTPHETRLAILEDDQLTEVYYERENEYTLAGSIYKGRVTRVLPGMQSAFVDLGLERDAFLYVTDFMEEQEDSSDFERIPANGRHDEGAAREPQARENREPRQPRAASAPEEEAPRRNGVPVSSGGSGQGATGEFEDGTRRWRGRRGRRKGFRPPQGGQQGAQEQGTPSRADGPSRNDAPHHSDAAPAAAVESGPRAPVAFSLPGESISKYGGQSAAPTSAPPVDSRAPQQRANVVIAKPSTLIETPLAWDGAGPLPGESISRYRGAPTEESHHEPLTSASVEEETAYDEEIAVSTENLEPHAIVAAEEQASPRFATETVWVPEVAAAPEAEVIGDTQEEVQSIVADEPLLAAVEFEPEEASASYRIDPSAPSEFRFASSSSGLAEEEIAPEEEAFQHIEDALPDSGGEVPFAASSTGLAELETEFDDPDEELDGGAPATGLVEEEEVAEEEEYDFTPLYVESEDHDLQELEEETLDQEVAAGGEIGDLVRDTHLEQRIDGEASGLTVEEEEAEDEIEAAEGIEETESEEGQVAAVAGQPARRPRDD